MKAKKLMTVWLKQWKTEPEKVQMEKTLYKDSLKI